MGRNPTLWSGHLAEKFSTNGRKIRGNSSQSGWEFQWGYAKIHIPKAGTYVLENIKTEDVWEVVEGVILQVRHQKEHEDATSVTAIDLSHPDWWQSLCELASEVLSTGRTTKCGRGVGLRDLPEITRGMKMCDHRLSDIQGLLYPEEEPAVNLDPDYQREHVWSDKQASEFVGYFIKSGMVGASLVPLIFINREENYSPERPDEVIDGKQRLTALRRWVEGEIPAFVEVLATDAIWYADTNEVERKFLPRIKIAYVNLDRENTLRFYLLLNAGGTVHTEQEISKVQTLLENELLDDLLKGGKS